MYCVAKDALLKEETKQKKARPDAKTHVKKPSRAPMLARRTVLLSALSLAVTTCLAQPSYYSETFIVEGNVNQPGRYYIRDYKRVYDAIQGAGGLKNGADRRVSIFPGCKRRDLVLRYGQ
jgi:hypothetical protein